MLHERLESAGFFSSATSGRSVDDDELDRVVVDETIRLRVRRRRLRLVLDDERVMTSSSLEWHTVGKIIDVVSAGGT